MLKMSVFTMLTWLMVVVVVATEATSTSCGRRRTDETMRENEWEQTEDNEYPWMVSLKEYKRDEYDPNWPYYPLDHNPGTSLCSGVILNEMWVLTSASCLANTNIGNTERAELIFGDWDYSYPDIDEDQRVVGEVVLHPLAGTKKNPSTEFDFALIKLDYALDFTRTYLMPICLQEDPDFDYTGQTGLFVSFGLVEKKPYLKPPKYYLSNELEVTVMSKEECQAAYGGSYLVTSNTYCTKVNTTKLSGPCSLTNDWGAPLFSSLDGQNYELIGITTYKMSCGGKPTIVSRVGSALGWIKITMKNFWEMQQEIKSSFSSPLLK